MHFSLKYLLVSAVLALGATAAHASEVLFTIHGANGAFEVTEAVVEKVGTISYKAYAPGLDDGLHEVRGPLMRDLLKEAGVQGDTASAVALDKYEVEIPTEDFDAFDVIAAVELDGKRLTVRSKGPAWIIYPSGDRPELKKDSVLRGAQHLAAQGPDR